MGKYSKKPSRARAKADELETAYRKMSGSKGRSKKAKKTNRAAAIIVICTALVAIVIGIATGCIYFNKTAANGIILDKVTVAGVDVGGMTQAQAIEAVRANSAVYNQSPMIVKVLDSSVEIPAAYVGMLNIKAAVKDAYKFGNTGSQSKRAQEQQIAMTEGYVVDLTPHLGLDSDAIKRKLAELGEKYSSVISQTTYEVTGTAPNHKLIVTLGVPEYGLDLNALYDQVMDSYSRFVFVVEGKCDMIEPDPIDLEEILSGYYIAPINASFDPQTFEIVEGVDGYGFDVESVRKQLAQTPFGSTVEILFTAIPPEITAADLSATLYRDTLSTYTAAHQSDNDRDVNLRLACEAINGTVLMPGDVFSYNEALGQRTASKGYRPGKSYSGNETVETIGGGICQVSSSLYYCALLADLEIIARDSHGFATSYMPLGMDATVSWGSLDFRFRNSTDHPIRIEASSSGGKTTVTLIGTDDKDYYVKMEYDTLNTYSYGISYRYMNSGNSEGYKDGDYIIEPYTGYDVKTYRCKYSKADDTLISRDFEDESNYRSRDGVVCRIEGSSSSGIGGSSGSSVGISGSGGGITPDGGALPD